MESEQVQSLKETIKKQAHLLGFDLVGVSSPKPPKHIDVYERWVEAGRHGKMDYLATPRAMQRRADLRQVLPECRSILALGMRYMAPKTLYSRKTSNASETTGRGNHSPSGQISAYAWGSDYHPIIEKRLEDLVSFIEKRVGNPFPNRWYVDTGPILERELAQRAGLGWIGKNTCLINPKHGSFFFLAELLIGLELEPDDPFSTDYCGSCNRCIQACPTGCILPDRTIDSRKCISYLTIELKESIPQEMRARLGNWVFGCDICQQVCPWNQRISNEDVDTAFAPRAGITSPNLVDELNLRQNDFNHKFKGSPIKRAKRRGYLRNVAVSLGNSQLPEAVSALTKVLLEDPEPLIREHAAWSLAQIGGAEAKQALMSAREKETHINIQREIDEVLVSFKY